MAKIKSTMDLVMEKTQHMTLSEEEKTQQHKADALKKIQGLIQQYQDKAIKLTEFARQFNDIRETYDDGDRVATREMLLEAIFSKLTPIEDNTRLLELLQSVCDIDPADFQVIFDDCHQQLDSQRQIRCSELVRQLAEDDGISGSAVIPNPEMDEGWQEIAAGVKRQYARRLDALKDRCSGLMD